MHGFEAPVHYYAVLGQRDRRSTQLMSPYIASFEIDFVGRDAVMEQITEVLSASLRDGYWSSITVVAEIGLGKSRLLQAVLDSARNSTFELMVVIGNYQRRSSAYSFLQDLLATRCQLKDDMSRSEIEHRIVAYVKASWNHEDAEATAHVMGYLAGFGFVDSPYLRSLQDGKSERSQMALATVAHWFRAQAESRPLLLLVDNLHWLDHSSLRLLEFLAQDLASLPGAIVAAARPTLREHYPNYMQNVAQHVEIELNRLNQDSIESIIDAVFAQVQDVPDVLLDLIRQRAEGNPLFVEEFVYMLLDNGIIEKDDAPRSTAFPRGGERKNSAARSRRRGR
jgi:predicted ATPase